MPRATGGDKRSSWQTFHRRLWVLRRLVRGPASADELIAEARRVFDPEIYPRSARAALRHDLHALRTEFDCVIRLQPDQQYALESLGRLALLDLPDADLEAFAFLLATFSEGALPNAPEVDALLDRLTALLPPERRAQLRRPIRDVQIEVPQRAGDDHPATLAILKRAVQQQQVAFAYRSTYAEGDAVVQHTVAPYALLFRDGHVYLDGYCLDCGVPMYNRRYRTYRLDRIVAGSVQILPTRLGPGAPLRPRYGLRYILAPAVARQRDITLWFPRSEVVFRPDGSALVTAETSDLWQARQILLRYREHCRVLEPAELITLLRESITRMAALYPSEAHSDLAEPLE